MKKLVLLTLLLSGIIKADDNFFSINRTTVDLAKNEQIQVQYTVGAITHISTGYKLYADTDTGSLDNLKNKIYLDIELLSGMHF